jgi:hypothetical protein
MADVVLNTGKPARRPGRHSHIQDLAATCGAAAQKLTP